jgi:hypothetical protein
MAQPLLISSGTVDITAQRPLMLGGFAKRIAPFRDIADRLEANGLVVRRGSSRAVIVTLDLLYPGEAPRAISIWRTRVSPRKWANCFVCITCALPMRVMYAMSSGSVDKVHRASRIAVRLQVSRGQRTSLNQSSAGPPSLDKVRTHRTRRFWPEPQGGVR